MVARLDGIVSPVGGVARVAVPKRGLYLTPRVVAVDVVRSVQTDLRDGSTPGFQQADASCLRGSVCLQEQHGSRVEGMDHRRGEEGQPDVSIVRNGTAGGEHCYR